MDTKSATAARVAAAVTKAGISRSALSKATGIPATTLFRKLNAHVVFDVNEIDLIAQALSVHPDSLVEFAEVAA